GPQDGEQWTAAAHLQPTIPKSDRLLERWCESHGLGAPQPGYLGLSHDDPVCTPAGQGRYDACVPIDIGLRPDPDVQVQDFAGGPHACMRFQGVGADIGMAWKYLLKELMPAQNLKPAETRAAGGGGTVRGRSRGRPDSDRFACWLCVPLLAPH
ncbi:MAG: GyrI-like domain-containing protein, partial [Burkholderiaceae bacterium]